MHDYVILGGALAFILGILAIGFSGNQRVQFPALFFLVGAALVLGGTGVELAGLIGTSGIESVAKG
jgi:hypothetical protein